MRVTIFLSILITVVYSECFFDRELCDETYGCSYGCYKNKCWKQCNRQPNDLWTKPEVHCSDKYSWLKEWCYIRDENDDSRRGRVECNNNEDCSEYGARPSCGSRCIT
ncbi:hypothetical protein ACHWQZ_G015952 [Mnemiopsis leidyi]